jgi:hypothetical protein
MQSSAVVTLRALVMLVCLVVVPLTAIFGSSLPQFFDSLIQGRGITRFVGEKKESNDPRTRGGDAPIFSTPTEANAPDAAAAVPPRGLDGTGSLWAPGAISAASHEQHGPAGANRPPDEHARTAQFDAAPAPMAGSAPQFAVPQPAANAARDPRAASEGFHAIERRLRELGATYYLLETWGNAGQMYRFHCKVAMENNPKQTRQFDGTDVEPLRAMRKVLDQVEQYRAGATP